MSHLQAPRSSSRRANSGAEDSEADAGRLSDATLTANEDSSAEETSTLIPLKSSSPPVVDDEEDDKCWICFGSRTEELIEPSTHGAWKNPCKCALRAHEGCLLDWISDMEKTPSSMNKPIRCPQCMGNILMRQDRSIVVETGRYVEKTVRRTNSLAILAGIGSAFFVTSSVYGVNAIYLICGRKEANAILMGPGGRDFQWTWRLAVGLPLIPMVLVVSRTRLLDATLPILPLIFFCHNEPFHLTLPPSPAITLALLPYVKSIYQGVYNKFLLPYDKKWTAEIGPTAAVPPAGDDDIGLEIAIGEEQLADDDEEEVLAEAIGAEAAADNAPAEPANANANVGGNANAEREEGWRVERELVLGPETANLVVGALLFPGVVASMGSIMGRIPLIKKMLPERFHRNILGGCLFILLKDLFNLYYKYKRAKQRHTRSIVNYRKPGKATATAQRR